MSSEDALMLGDTVVVGAGPIGLAALLRLLSGGELGGRCHSPGSVR